MSTQTGEAPIPNAGDRTKWTQLEPEREGEMPALVFRIPLDEPSGPGGGLNPRSATRRRRKSAVFEAPAIPEKPTEIAPEPVPGSWKRRGLTERLRRLLPLLLHELADLEGFDEREIRYGDERGSALLPKIRLKRKKRSSREQRGRSLGSYPILKRIVPDLTSWGEEQDCYRFVFRGYRPESVHILGRVLETGYKFRLEDLSRFAAHGDYLLHALEHVDAGSPCLDPDAILYCPAVDSDYPFKFAVCAAPGADNVVVYQALLRRIFDHTESVESFRDRFFSEIKLGFEKFGPACATPQFQEVELRLWKLISDSSTSLQINAAEASHISDGPRIRHLLKRIQELHRAIDDCAALPSELAAFYRLRFDLPFGKLFEHALAGLEAIAKTVGCNLADRPRDIETLTELVTTFRRLDGTAPAENLEHLDLQLAAAYAGQPAPSKAHVTWVRRYAETIFTGADRFDERRFKKK